MKLLIIEFANSAISKALNTQAVASRPKPEFISTMNLSTEKLNVEEFKNMVRHLHPDTIIINAPETVPLGTKWYDFLRTVCKQVEILSGKVMFLSRSEALGDGSPRTEACKEMPVSDTEDWLLQSEQYIEKSTSRHFIMRLPFLEDSGSVRQWLHWHQTADQVSFIDPGSDQNVTLGYSSEVASVLLEQVQSGLFGKYHITPNDKVMLSTLVNHLSWAPRRQASRMLDASLASKYTWRTLSPSLKIWERLVKEYK